MGYARAGFEVVGVDINPQPRYPFEFHQADALDYLREHGHRFDAVHASPPCQAYSETRKIQSNEHPELIPPTRAALQRVGLPWVIENVPGSPLIDPVELCGAMFGLRVYRHRLFEASFPVTVPEHPAIEYEFEISQNGEWQAGGTTTDAETALKEAKHYELMYGQDGPVTVKFYEKRELSRDQMRASLPPNALLRGRATAKVPCEART